MTELLANNCSRKFKTQKQVLFFSVIIVMVLVVSPPLVLAELDPLVTEEPVTISNQPWLEYTVTNPNPSTIGDIVAFVIEVDPLEHPFGGTKATNGWIDQPLYQDFPAHWDSLMFVGDSWPLVTFPLTWREFFGGIDYPFGSSAAAGFFLEYSEISPNTFAFDNPSLAISPGETLDQFFSLLVEPSSTYLSAYLDDASSDTFDNTGLSYFQGEAIPEPSTIALLGLGGLALIRRRQGN